MALAEVLVAALVLAAGSAGVFGTLHLAGRMVARAEALEWSASRVGAIRVGLRAGTLPSSGQRIHPEGRVRWTRVAAGTGSVVRVEITPAGAERSRAFLVPVVE